jgi:hypothetical protein
VIDDFLNFDVWRESVSDFQAGQQVVYVDDFMPYTVETITSIEDGWVTFNKGSRGCIATMVRPATQDEIKKNKRLMIAQRPEQDIFHKPEKLPFI